MVQMETMRPVVLIVEDEFLIGMDAVDMVRVLDFDVVEAENADEAIFILEDRRDITVVFTDIQMPGAMDGLKLAAAIRGAGRRSGSWRPRDFSISERKICRRAAGSCQNPTAL